jgi:hypothetical protein
MVFIDAGGLYCILSDTMCEFIGVGLLYFNGVNDCN